MWPEADPERPNHLGAVACGCDPVDLPIMAGDVLLGFNAAANGSPRHTLDGRPAIAWHDHRTAIGVRPLGCDPGRTLCGPPQPIGRFLRTVRTNASLSRVGQHPPAPVCVAQVGNELHDRCAVFSPGCQTGLQHDPTTDGDGFGDHCDAPLLVERCAPDQVQADDGACRPTSGIRLSHLFLEDYVPTPVGMDPEPIDLLSSTLWLEEQSDAFFLQQMILAAAPQQDEADQLPVPAEPDQPPVRHRQQERLLCTT